MRAKGERALEKFPFQPTRLRQEFLRGLDAIQSLQQPCRGGLCLSPGSRPSFWIVAHGRKRNRGLTLAGGAGSTLVCLSVVGGSGGTTESRSSFGDITNGPALVSV
jgi:hypothetical protein